MTRILLVTDLFFRLERTGLDVYCDNLVYWLPRLAPNANFVLASLDKHPQNFLPFAENLRYQSIPLIRRDLYLRSIFRPAPILSYFEEPFDLVHLLVPLPLTANVPLVATIHDLTPVLFPNLYSWHSRWLFNRTLCYLSKHHLLAVSNCTARDMEKHYHVTSEVVYEGVDDSFRPLAASDYVRQKYKLPTSYFLYLGSMHKRKNLEAVLRAFKRFRQEYGNDMKLVLAGRMSLGGSELMEYIKVLAMNDEVILAGYIEQADLPAVISMAQALLYASWYEGFGLPVLEAMACGTPVIAANAGAIPEIAGTHALLCDPQDVDCLTEAMHRLVSEQDFRQQLVQEGLGWVRNFSWKAAAQKTLNTYERLLGHG